MAFDCLEDIGHVNRQKKTPIYTQYDLSKCTKQQGLLLAYFSPLPALKVVAVLDKRALKTESSFGKLIGGLEFNLEKNQLIYTPLKEIGFIPLKLANAAADKLKLRYANQGISIKSVRTNYAAVKRIDQYTSREDWLTSGYL